jgi:cytochrome c-type biogenesis protein CcmH
MEFFGHQRLRRHLVTVGAVVLVLVVGGPGAAPASGSEQHPTLLELEAEIMCPTCHTTLDQSNSLEAQRIQAFISQRISAGDTKSEIKDKLVEQFGEAILAAPPRRGWDLLIWWLPVAMALAGAAALGLGAWRWSRLPRAFERSEAPPLDPELERRLDEELARL